MGDKKITIFLDGISSHSFIKPTVAAYFPNLVHTLHLFKVRVANGAFLICESWIPALIWELQEYEFTHDCYVLKIKPYDLILGVDWMKKFSPITFDSQNL